MHGCKGILTWLPSDKVILPCMHGMFGCGVGAPLQRSEAELLHVWCRGLWASPTSMWKRPLMRPAAS